MQVLIAGLGVILAIALVLIGWRMVRGPSFADRFIALDMLTAIAVSFAGLITVASGRHVFLDIGLGIALINFAATAAFSVFLEQKQVDR